MSKVGAACSPAPFPLQHTMVKSQISRAQLPCKAQQGLPEAQLPKVAAHGHHNLGDVISSPCCQERGEWFVTSRSEIPIQPYPISVGSVHQAAHLEGHEPWQRMGE